jgi:hypothetical protein
MDLNIILNSIESIIILLIIILGVVGLLIIALKILFWVLDQVLTIGSQVLSTSLKWLFAIAFVLGVLMCSFNIILYPAWYLFPNSLNIDINSQTHNSEIDLSTLSVEGTFVDTGTSYLMKPNLPFTLPVIPKLSIIKTDDKHIIVSGLKFKKIQMVQQRPVETSERLNISTMIDRFVPDR